MNRCADCGGTSAAMLAMKPGIDDVEWSLCSRCWIATSKRDVLTAAKRTARTTEEK